MILSLCFQFAFIYLFSSYSYRLALCCANCHRDPCDDHLHHGDHCFGARLPVCVHRPSLDHLGHGSGRRLYVRLRDGFLVHHPQDRAVAADDVPAAVAAAAGGVTAAVAAAADDGDDAPDANDDPPLTTVSTATYDYPPPLVVSHSAQNRRISTSSAGTCA